MAENSVNISVQVPQSNNNIHVFVPGSTGEITARDNLAESYANLAKDWAVKMDGLVDNTDNSAKFYALSAKQDAEQAVNAAATAEVSAQRATDSITQIEETIQTTGEETLAIINQAGEEAVNNISNVVDEVKQVQNEAITEINTAVTTGVNSISEVVSEVNEAKNDALTEIGLTKNSALSDIDTATEEALEALDKVGNVENKANIDLDNLSPKGENHFLNKDLSNLTPEGEKHFLNHTQITDCILEAPNMFNMSIQDNQLHLDAGAKVIVPYGTSAPTMAIGDTLNNGTIVDISWDGSKLFYIVQYSNDLLRTPTHDETVYLYIRSNGIFEKEKVSRSFSGGTVPTLDTNNNLWYDTTNNIVKYTLDKGVSWVDYNSLPIGKATSTTTAFTDILETYQHVGALDTTVWLMKGVKGLVPNGRNADGTLSNMNATSANVVVTEEDLALNGGNIFAGVDVSGAVVALPYFRNYGAGLKKDIPVFTIENLPTTGYVYYATDENLYYYWAGNNWQETRMFMIAKPKLTGLFPQPVTQLITNNGGVMHGNLTVTDVQTPITCQFANIDLSIIPTTTNYAGIRFEDINGKRIGVVEVGHTPTNSADIRLIGTYQNTDGTEVSQGIKVGYTSTGSPYVTLSNNPPAADNSTQIATTAWVRGKGVLINKYINGKSWYRIYSDGWCVQAGITTNTVTSATITFLKTFKDTNYTITLGDGNPTSTDTGGVADSANYKQTTTTGFGISLVKGRSVFWKAEGYLAAGQY